MDQSTLQTEPLSGATTEPPAAGARATPPAATPLPSRDIRARRPYFLGSLLNLDNYRRFIRIVSLMALDLGGVVASLYSALALKEIVRGNYVADQVWATATDFVPFVFLITALLFARGGLYGHREGRPGFVGVIGALTGVAAVALVFAIVQGYAFSSYYLFYGTLFFAAFYISALRVGFEWSTGRVLRALGYRRRALLVGSGRQIEAVAHALENSPHVRYDAVGFVSLTPLEAGNGLRDLGRFEDLPSRLESESIDEVVIADPDFPEERAMELIDQCHRHGVTVRIAPSTMGVLIHRAEFVPGQGVPLFELSPPALVGFDYVLKRSFDFLGSALLLAISAPFLLVVAALIKITSPGPAIYRSSRPGIGGEPFDCLKFRTMHNDAEQNQAELEEHNEQSGALFKIREDPRLTRLGYFLRRFSLDELPQLLNVLKGEMSLVGPRPLPLRDYERLEDWHRKRYLVLPGITGLWQVSGRSDLDFDDMVRLDFLYLERWSVFLDLTILIKTVPAVFIRKGAY